MPVQACLDWMEACREGLIREKFEALQHFVQGQALADRYAYFTERDFDVFFSNAEDELQLSTYLSIVASCESRLRSDARQRRLDASNTIGQKLKLLFDAFDPEWKIPFGEDGILDAWKEAVQADLPKDEWNRYVSAIGALKPCISIRHWIAHGRYWAIESLQVIGVIDELVRRVTRLFERLNEYVARQNLESVG